MLRYCTSLLLLLSAAAVVSAADETLKIRWHGQSMFEIVSTDGVVLVTDPHAIKEFRDRGVPKIEADAIFISHFHNDHTQVGAISNAAKLEESKHIFRGLKENKFDGRVTVEFNNLKDSVKKKDCKKIDFYTVGTYHDTVGGMNRGKNGVFVFEVDGLRIVHLGDLGHTLTDAQIKRIGEVDILFIPVGGIYTLNGLDAARVVEQLRPKRYVLPMHYGTEYYTDVLGAKYFTDEFKPEQVKRLTTNELQVDPKAKVPGEPTIVLLKAQP
jgi:L-ascorbate metabolism protein UlaG (beta-lactamase superfamily)